MQNVVIIDIFYTFVTHCVDNQTDNRITKK